MYNSQAGVFYELPEGLHLHELGLMATGPAAAVVEEVVAACLASEQTSLVVGSASPPAGAQSLAAKLCADANALAEAQDTAYSQVAFEASVGKVDGADPDTSVAAAVELVQAAIAADLVPRVTLLGAVGSTGGHTPCPYDVASWTAELADVGCEVIVLGCEPNADEDGVEEVVGACKEADVVGVPMQWRIGLRAWPRHPMHAAAVLWQPELRLACVGCVSLSGTGIDPATAGAQFEDIVDAAVQQGVLCYDCCVHGATAPSPSRLLDALQSAGFEMDASDVEPLVSLSTKLSQ
eukprot:COSAG01_NODE_5881_length_3971_cov_6.184353_4_plen_293_part_00